MEQNGRDRLQIDRPRIGSAISRRNANARNRLQAEYHHRTPLRRRVRSRLAAVVERAA